MTNNLESLNWFQILPTSINICCLEHHFQSTERPTIQVLINSYQVMKEIVYLKLWLKFSSMDRKCMNFPQSVHPIQMKFIDAVKAIGLCRKYNCVRCIAYLCGVFGYSAAQHAWFVVPAFRFHLAFCRLMLHILQNRIRNNARVFVCVCALCMVLLNHEIS